MIESDALGDFEGPTTLRYFASLLMIAVMVHVVGYLLSLMYGITFVERLSGTYIHNPMALLSLAGTFALGGFLLKHLLPLLADL